MNPTRDRGRELALALCRRIVRDFGRAVRTDEPISGAEAVIELRDYVLAARRALTADRLTLPVR